MDIPIPFPILFSKEWIHILNEYDSSLEEDQVEEPKPKKASVNIEPDQEEVQLCYTVVHVNGRKFDKCIVNSGFPYTIMPKGVCDKTRFVSLFPEKKSINFNGHRIDVVAAVKNMHIQLTPTIGRTIDILLVDQPSDDFDFILDQECSQIVSKFYENTSEKEKDQVFQILRIT